MICLLGYQWDLSVFQYLFEHIGKENGDLFDIDSTHWRHAGLGGCREGVWLEFLPSPQEFAIDLAKLFQD
jgi:hypothetical protein